MCTVNYHIVLNKKIRENYDRKILSKTEDNSNKKEKQNLAYTVHLYFLKNIQDTIFARKLHGHEVSHKKTTIQNSVAQRKAIPNVLSNGPLN